MFTELMEMRIELAVPYRQEIRECVYCAYESKTAEKCPRCSGHSFIKYYQSVRRKVA